MSRPPTLFGLRGRLTVTSRPPLPEACLETCLRAAGPIGRLLAHAARVALALDRCAACHGLREPQAHALLCASCARELAPRLAGYCPGCGALHAQEDALPYLCGECLREPRPWDSLLFHGPYQGRLKEILLAFKFNQGLSHSKLLQVLAVMAFARRGPDLPDIVTPVPLHPRRLAWRGYNQSLELARGLSRELGRPVAHSALTRIRHTPPQASLDARARRINLLGAFRADPGQVEDRSVLLVDDIMTTGATIEQCALVLKAAGAARVDVLVVARA